MTRTSLLTSTALAWLLVPLIASGADRLNVKVGLWEVSSSMQMSGTLPLSKDLREKLTPEQVARMQAQMKADAAKGPVRDTARECITEKDLEQPFDSSNAKECRQTIATTKRTSQEIHIVCDGEYKGSGVLKINTPTPETMTGMLDLKMGTGADVFTINGTLNGRWLGADCGDETDEADSDDDEPADDEEEEE